MARTSGDPLLRTRTVADVAEDVCYHAEAGKEIFSRHQYDLLDADRFHRAKVQLEKKKAIEQLDVNLSALENSQVFIFFEK